MSDAAKKLLAEALTLSEEERALLANDLFESVRAGDDLDDEDRARLHAALIASDDEVARGQLVAADILIANLPR